MQARVTQFVLFLSSLWFVQCGTNSGLGLELCPDGTMSARCVPMTCVDEQKGGAETDVDCGGPTCYTCADGRGCASGSDCNSGYCGAGVCRTPSCSDGDKNASETDTDCGGGNCPGCATGKVCVANNDCASKNCVAGSCAAPLPTCTDGIQNASETDVDCGGPTCGKCTDLKSCTQATDCLSAYCGGNRCAAPTCTDVVRNGVETDVDCGGPTCGKCADQKQCNLSSDCMSSVCTAKTCVSAACVDMTRNGQETDVDCGGPACLKCADLKTCAAASDCMSGVCSGTKCQVPSCTDIVKNGSESDVDCGGPACSKCLNNKACIADTDCQSMACDAKVCVILPTIASMSPAAGTPLGGTPITITGTGFATGATVTIGGAAAVGVTVVSPTQITATTPKHTAGMVDVVVRNPSGRLATGVKLFSYGFTNISFGMALGNTVGTSVNGVAVADLNGDGKPDLVVCSSADNNLSVLLGIGDGKMQTAVPYALPAGSAPRRLVTGDYNGDGKADAVTINQNSTISVFIGNGDGTLKAAAQYPGATSWASAVTADFNNDTFLDVMVADSSGGTAGTYLLRGNGNGTFNAPMSTALANFSYDLAVGDFDKNGVVDAAVSAAFTADSSVILGKGDGTFNAPKTVTTAGASSGIAVADFNGDTNPDVVFSSNSGSTLSFVSGNGNGTFNAAMTLMSGYTQISKLVTADFDLDGRPDLGFASRHSSMGGGGVILSNGDGTFKAPILLPGYKTIATGVAAADFNGDGLPDLVALTNLPAPFSSGFITVHLNTSS